MGTLSAHRLTLLLFAALAAVAACLAAVVTGSWLAAGLAAGAGALVLTAFLVGWRNDSQDKETLLRKAAQAAEESRKLVIYEQATGLLASWFVAMRGDEECARAHRFQRPLTLALIKTEADPGDWVAQGYLADWLRNHLRTVDIIGCMGNSRYLVLMPDTSVAGAQRALERLRAKIDSVRMALACFPEDGSTFKRLHAAAEARLELDAAAREERLVARLVSAKD